MDTMKQKTYRNVTEVFRERAQKKFGGVCVAVLIKTIVYQNVRCCTFLKKVLEEKQPNQTPPLHDIILSKQLYLNT